MPDVKYSEQIAAWIQRRQGSYLTADDVLKFCDGQITHFKKPKYIKFVTEYPITVTGKMQKSIMRDEYSKELGLSA